MPAFLRENERAASGECSWLPGLLRVPLSAEAALHVGAVYASLTIEDVTDRPDRRQDALVIEDMGQGVGGVLPGDAVGSNHGNRWIQAMVRRRSHLAGI